MSPYITTTDNETCSRCESPARFKGVTIPYGVYFAYCLEHMKEFMERFN